MLSRSITLGVGRPSRIQALCWWIPCKRCRRSAFHHGQRVPDHQRTCSEKSILSSRGIRISACAPSSPLLPRYKGQEAGDNADNNISCSLFIVTLDDHPTPEYEAVSYVWGSNSDLQAISLNRERFWVTKNLSEALKAFCLPDRDRVLWIDAPAINQSSFSERAEQVTLIPEIYMHAGDTLIWLNDDNLCKIEENPLWAHLCNRRGRRQTGDVSPIRPREILSKAGAEKTPQVYCQTCLSCSIGIEYGQTRKWYILSGQLWSLPSVQYLLVSCQGLFVWVARLLSLAAPSAIQS